MSAPRRVVCSWALLRAIGLRGMQPAGLLLSIRSSGAEYDTEHIYGALPLLFLSDRSYTDHGGRHHSAPPVVPIARIPDAAACTLELEPPLSTKGAPKGAPGTPRHNLQGGSDGPTGA